MTEHFETVEAQQVAEGDTISYKVYGVGWRTDKIEQGTVTGFAPSEDGYKCPVIISVRLANGLIRHHEMPPTQPVRRYL